MKEANILFFELEEKPNDDFWNGIHFKKLGGRGVVFKWTEYDITSELQEVFTVPKGTLAQKLKNKNKIYFSNILKSVQYENYKPKHGESS